LKRQSHKLYLIAAAFFLSGVYVFIFSESGILERRNLDLKKQRLVSVMSELKTENRELEAIYKEYLSGSIPDNDFQKSGYTGRGDRLLFFKEGVEKENNAKPVTSSDDNRVNLGHMRLVWLILSALIMIFLFSRLITSMESTDEKNQNRNN
jgi:hypothetical protein